jgi:hypothetical protein
MMKSVPRVLLRCPPHDKIMPQLSCKENHRFMAQTKHKGGLADKLILFALQLGVAGVPIATVISNVLSAGMVLTHLARRNDDFALQLRQHPTGISYRVFFYV